MERRDFLRAMAAAPFAMAASAQTRFQPTWESIDKRPSPQWYTDAKFGIFIHWGVYSVPAFAAVNVKGETGYAEWYWNSLVKNKRNGKGPTLDFHNRVYGADFEYFNFAPMFRCEAYNPDHWADVFVRAGAKYVALTSKHHEGYTLWKNEQANKTWNRPWNAVDIGPKRDILLDLMTAGRKRNLEMGVYYSLYEWYNPLWLSDKKRYVAEHMTPQFKDLVTHVKPSIIFSDGEWDLPSADWKSTELLAWLFNESPVKDHVVINDRWGKDSRHKHGGYYTTEYTSGMEAASHPWEESRGMGFSYGYNRMETAKDYHTARELLMMLIDIVSRGGNLLLDIGPTGDGRIPVEMEERLLAMGEWLKPNGEAIYGTKQWRHPRQWSAGQVPKFEQKEFMADYKIGNMVDTPPTGYARVDAFLTQKPGVLYAIVPRRPLKEVVVDDVEAGAGVKVTMLEGGQAFQSRMEGKKLRIAVPDSVAAALPHRQAYTFKIAGAK
jgi:alpha-L-fucosidase